jgi:hypothetical protein
MILSYFPLFCKKYRFFSSFSYNPENFYSMLKQNPPNPLSQGGTKPLSFNLDATDGHARAGTIITPHGVIETPIFMPVGTRSAVK